VTSAWPAPVAAPAPDGGGAYLRSYLQPFQTWLDAGDVTEIIVNQPGELWVERVGVPGMTRHDAPDIDAALLQRLAFQIARISHQGVSRESPLLSATLGEGARVQIIAPPATRAHLALAIRKHVLADLSLDQYTQGGGFAAITAPGEQGERGVQAHLRQLLDAHDYCAFLKAAVAARRTILLSGGTSSGKTTLLNALLKEIPARERVIVIEDTPEIRLAHANALGLVAVPGNLGEARVSIDDLMRASLRMRPDRLLVGELRGPEAITFLRAINTGHPGSLATIHASSPEGAFEQISLMCLQAELGLSRDASIPLARSLIDIVVQLRLIDGQRVVSSIEMTKG
jgi:type IV secretion system protein VirB11